MQGTYMKKKYIRIFTTHMSEIKWENFV